MAAFTDNQQRHWPVRIDVNALRRVKDLAGVNLATDVFGETLLPQLANDPLLLANVLYAIIKPDADQRGISDEQFGQAHWPATPSGRPPMRCWRRWWIFSPAATGGGKSWQNLSASCRVWRR